MYTPVANRTANISNQTGATLLELLAALAVIGILAGISAVGLRSNNSRLFANDARQLLQQAKFESIKRDEGVSVVWSADERVLVSFVDLTGACLAPATRTGTGIATARIEDYQRLEVTNTFPGVTWQPNGIPTACDGSVLNESRALTVNDGRNQRSIFMTVIGEVNIK